MLILLSPSKTIDESKSSQKQYTIPEFLNESKKLVEKFKNYSIKDLQEKMHISKKIAESTKKRFSQFSIPHSLKNSKQALFSFKGTVYRDIKIKNYTKEDFSFSQKHLRILSGLYGILKPLDLIQPYRLEMKHVTSFWIDKIHESIKKEQDEVIINLASQEYTAALGKLNNLGRKIITPIFKEKKNDEYKIITIYTKFARGTFANWIIKNKITNYQELKQFSEDGYKFQENLSSKNNLVFTRK